MSTADIPGEALAIVEIIAGAIRDELGEEIDAYPGLDSPERADPMNRAFRAVVATILGRSRPDEADLPRLVSRILLGVAERRLAAEGWDEDQVRRLIVYEPGERDDWLAFLILSSRPQFAPILDPDDDPA